MLKYLAVLIALSLLMVTLPGSVFMNDVRVDSNEDIEACIPGLTYIPIQYDIADNIQYDYHAWLEYFLPLSSGIQFLNVILQNELTGDIDWLGVNIPLPPGIDGGLPVRTKLDLASISAEGLMPEVVLAYVHLGEYQMGPEFPADSCLLVGLPESHHVPSGSAMDWHPTIPYFPPILPPIILPDSIRVHYRGCEVPNIDLDSLLHPVDPLNPDAGTSDINACGPSAAANSLHWLDQEHDEISIPGNLRSSLDSLKKMMKQNAEGVLWDDLIKGKLAFIDKYQLPIHVKFQSHINAATIPSPDPTYGHVADNETLDGNHPQFDWLADEMDAGEDVEVLMGFYCDTIEYDTTIVSDTLENGDIIMTEVIDTIMRKNRKGGHYVNMTGYLDLGNGAKWVAFKHDVVQEGPEGTIEEFSAWEIDTAGYAIIRSQSSEECTAYVESVTSESYDPTVEFCPLVRIPDDSGVGSMRWALSVVNPGGKIKIDLLMAGDTIVLLSTLEINIDVEIESAVDITVNGGSIARPFAISDSVSVHLDNIDIIGGTAIAGSAIENMGVLTLENSSVVRGPGAQDGAEVISNVGGQIIILGTTNVHRDD